ncbi:MAG: hypothetical protein EOM11_09755 [Erysipelotrichia bacterium]|nr:hypothetical protein [Erysipelotrichia bacterium]
MENSINCAIKYQEDFITHMKNNDLYSDDMEKEQEVLLEYIKENVITIYPNTYSRYIQIKEKSDVLATNTILRMIKNPEHLDMCLEFNNKILENAAEVYEEFYSTLPEDINFAVIANHDDEETINAFLKSNNNKNIFIKFDKKPNCKTIKALVSQMKKDNRIQIYKDELQSTFTLGINASNTAVIRNYGMSSPVYVDVSSCMVDVEDRKEVDVHRFIESLVIAVRTAMRGTLKGYSPSSKVFETDRTLNVVITNIEPLIEEFGIGRVSDLISYSLDMIITKTEPQYASALRIASPLGLTSAIVDGGLVTAKDFQEHVQYAQQLGDVSLNPIQYKIPMFKESWAKLPKYLYDNWDDYRLVFFYDYNTHQ